MVQFPLKMRAFPEGQSPPRLYLQCFSIYHTVIDPKTSGKLSPIAATQMFQKLYRSHLSIDNVKTYLWTLWSVLVEVAQQIPYQGEEWKKLEEILEGLKGFEEPAVWEGCEIAWARLPGLNWARYDRLNRGM